MLLRGGTVIDGSAAPALRADVLVRDGHVAAIGAGLDARGARQVDVTGAVVCPGFVDIHTHSDLTLLANPDAPSKVHQGVTTEVVGNCGLGVAPLPAGCDRAAIRAAVSYLDLDPDVAWPWDDIDGYLATLEKTPPSVNVATLVPHLVLHAATVGFGDRAPGPAELDALCGLLADALDAGAAGLSTGLVYAPLTFAREAELDALAAVTAARGKVFAWHVRSYDDDLVPSVRQAVDVARRTGCRTQISHLAAVGRRNWGTVRQALDLVDAARAEGFDIGVDVYPYLHGNAPLAQLLPASVQENGLDPARLVDPAVRAEVRQHWAHQPLGWAEITVSRVPDAAPVTGHTIAELAVIQARQPDEVALDLLAMYGTGVLIVAGGRSEDDLRTVLGHPATVVASDGLALDPHGVTGAGSPHPRSYGCFPRYLSRYAGADLPAAIARCTSRPAAIAGLTDRGVLRPGAPADLVVLRPELIRDTADFAEPQRYPDGIDLVLVGGEPVVVNGTHTGARPGSVLRVREGIR
ncbi:N-acyl-D-amino-acid deacylase family protein [Amycolatopsis antarctica]|nr:amidohydrolase family protein [Amycolatopsis antarctica]